MQEISQIEKEGVSFEVKDLETRILVTTVKNLLKGIDELND